MAGRRASLTLSAACLRLALVWSAWPSASSRGLSVAHAPSLTCPLSSCDLLRVLFRLCRGCGRRAPLHPPRVLVDPVRLPRRDGATCHDRSSTTRAVTTARRRSAANLPSLTCCVAGESLGVGDCSGRPRLPGEVSRDRQGMSITSDEQPPEIITNVPQTARIWNYWLGGKDNFPVDRQVGDQILEAFPAIVENARASRAFLARAVRYLAGEAASDKFFDIGTGLPTANNTHQVAWCRRRSAASSMSTTTPSSWRTPVPCSPAPPRAPPPTSTPTCATPKADPAASGPDAGLHPADRDHADGDPGAHRRRQRGQVDRQARGCRGFRQLLDDE